MTRVEVCDRCGRTWNVSRQCDTQHGYICPACDVKMGGERIPVYLIPKEESRHGATDQDGRR